jgi:hypothetical protein
MASPRNEDRRTTPRFQVVDYVAAEVVLERPGSPQEATSVPVYLRDVSKEGLGFFVPIDLGLSIGMAVTIALGQHSSPVRLRWVSKSEDDLWVECGAAFIETAPDVLPWIEDAFGGEVKLTGDQSRIDRLAMLFGQPAAE